MDKQIKMIDLPLEYEQNKAEINDAVLKVLAKGQYIQGEEVKIFEKNLAEFLGVKHVISCGNGTDALQIALMALDIQKGDEVIIPAFSYIAVAETVCLLGAIPILVDVDPIFFQLDNELVEKAITEKTKALIPVHLFGQCGNMKQLLNISQKYNIPVIEDVAQALGGKIQIKNNEIYLGTLGDIGCTSFFPTKNLSCFGDGGAMFTNNDELAKKLRMIASHGQSVRYSHEIIGINSRLDTLQAAILNVKLPYLNQNTHKKQEIAQWYFDLLKGNKHITLPQVYKDSIHCWHQFTIKVNSDIRDDLKKHLYNKGIESMIYYPKPIGAQNAYLVYQKETPNSIQLCNTVLSLPIHPLLNKEDIVYLCNEILIFLNGNF